MCEQLTGSVVVLFGVVAQCVYPGGRRILPQLEFELWAVHICLQSPLRGPPRTNLTC
jgi:hypothetical protein